MMRLFPICVHDTSWCACLRSLHPHLNVIYSAKRYSRTGNKHNSVRRNISSTFVHHRFEFQITFQDFGIIFHYIKCLALYFAFAFIPTPAPTLELDDSIYSDTQQSINLCARVGRVFCLPLTTLHRNFHFYWSVAPPNPNSIWINLYQPELFFSFVLNPTFDVPLLLPLKELRKLAAPVRRRNQNMFDDFFHFMPLLILKIEICQE